MDTRFKEFGLTEDAELNIMFSLTHRSMMLEIGNDQDSRIEYYLTIGKPVYEYLLTKFIVETYSKDSNVISEAVKDTKFGSIIKMYDRMNLDDYTIVSEYANEDKVKTDIVLQFYGLLYDELKLVKTYEIFKKYFFVSDIELGEDYLSIVSMVARGEHLNFTEVERTGPAHDLQFTYRFDFKGEIIVATGKSKKDAKQNCAKVYCSRKLTSSDIKRLYGIDQPKKITTRNLLISERQNSLIANKAIEWGFRKEELRNALTNKLLYPRFNLINYNYLLNLGSIIENIKVAELIYSEYSTYSKKQNIVARQLLVKNDIVYSNIINSLDLSDLIILKGSDLKSIPEDVINRDVVRILMFYAFESNNSSFWNKHNRIAHNLLNEEKLQFLNASNNINEFIEIFNFNKPKIEVVRIDSPAHDSQFKAIFNFQLEEMSITIEKVGVSKIDVTEKVHRIFWVKLYNYIESSFKQEIKTDYTDEPFYNYTLKRILNNVPGLIFMIKEFRFPIYDSFTNNRFEDFITGLHFLVRNIKASDQIELYDIVQKQLSNRYNKLTFKGYNVLVSAIWEYVVSKKEEIQIDTAENVMLFLEDKSNIIFEEILSKDGNEISKIVNPTEKLQEIAVSHNPEAIAYIEKPSENITKVAYAKDPTKIEKNPEIVNQLIHLKEEEIIEYVKAFDTTGQNIFMIDQFCFDIYLKAIISKYEVKKLYIACGFVFASGLNLISQELDLLLSSDYDVRIIAGNLQNYHREINLKTMDIDTAKVLNVLIEKGIRLRTIQEKFYHGKIYILESEEYVFIINGSTNMSRNAFRNNSEIDNLILYNKNSNKHSMHFLDLWEAGNQIDKLDENKFSKLEINNFDDTALITIDEVAMRNKVLSLNDQALKERLLLWLTYKPNNIYDKINVAEREYIAVEYKDRNMIVLESFYPSNSYFVFYDLEINELLRTIEGKSKKEIFMLSNMEKRGYHLKEKLMLEIKIKTYFI